MLRLLRSLHNGLLSGRIGTGPTCTCATCPDPLPDADVCPPPGTIVCYDQSTVDDTVICTQTVPPHVSTPSGISCCTPILRDAGRDGRSTPADSAGLEGGVSLEATADVRDVAVDVTDAADETSGARRDARMTPQAPVVRTRGIATAFALQALCGACGSPATTGGHAGSDASLADDSSSPCGQEGCYPTAQEVRQPVLRARPILPMFVRCRCRCGRRGCLREREHTHDDCDAACARRCPGLTGDPDAVSISIPDDTCPPGTVLFDHSTCCVPARALDAGRNERERRRDWRRRRGRCG